MKLLSSFHWGLTTSWAGDSISDVAGVAVLFSLRSNLCEPLHLLRCRVVAVLFSSRSNNFGMAQTTRGYCVAVLFSLRSNLYGDRNSKILPRLLSSFHWGLTRYHRASQKTKSLVAVLFSSRSNEHLTPSDLKDISRRLLSSFHRGLTWFQRRTEKRHLCVAVLFSLRSNYILNHPEIEHI